MKKHKNNHNAQPPKGRETRASGKSSDRPPGNFKSKPEKRPERTSAPKPQNALARADLYGFHAVSAAWLNEERQIQALYVCDQALEGLKPVMEEALAKNIKRPPAHILEKKQLEFLLPQGAVHQGVALVCAPLPEIGLRDLLIKGEKQEKSTILILDQVTDPHNIGAILRSACAFGVTGVVMQRRHAPELTAALAKTACGAIEHIPVAYETNLSRAIEEMQKADYYVFGLDERGECTIDALDIPRRAALVLGAEGPGIRHLVKERCDQLVRLPMSGPMPSINVSNAAAIALYVTSSRK
ncbi:MAG: 23S rRNA (guanosine(2251)-2'-O)-methyltransferase RlmB [Alphaproteobacteria bacterium]|nr:23S rRNA (guanosine(2251)-2'-O)-methyltransferase RlmB [Alphaproteobacteria bacterium]